MDLFQKKLELIESYIISCNISSKEVLTFDEAATYLGFSKSALYKMTSKKEIPFYVPGGKKIFFRRTEIDEWIFKNKINSSDDLILENEIYLTRNIKSKL